LLSHFVRYTQRQDKAGLHIAATDPAARIERGRHDSRSPDALAPGFALSAPELAGQLTMRPAQVQRSLDKLRKYELVDSLIGSTDGFDNYRLTQSGAFFLADWQRRENGGQPPTATALIK